MHNASSLLAALNAMDIHHPTHTHAPVMTVADSTGILDHLPGAHIKNLFLKDKAGQLYLVTALEDRQLALNALGKHLKAKDRLSFADADTLWQHLGVKPGSVSPLALINATAGSIRFILDEGVMSHQLVNPHPLRNNMTTALAPADLIKAVKVWGHHVEIIDLGLFPRTPTA